MSVAWYNGGYEESESVCLTAVWGGLCEVGGAVCELFELEFVS